VQCSMAMRCEKENTRNNHKMRAHADSPAKRPAAKRIPRVNREVSVVGARAFARGRFKPMVYER